MPKAMLTPLLPHGPLTPLTEGLWVVEGSLPNMALKRNMAAWRLPSGGLALHSVVRMDDAGMAALDALGRPELLIVPNEGHRLDIQWYKQRYPDAKVLSPRNARAKVEEVIAVDADCEDVLAEHGVRHHRPAGMKDGYELIYELDLPAGGRALVVNDVLAVPSRLPGFGGMVTGLLGPKGGFGIPRIVRFFFGKDMKAYRGFLEGLAETPDLRLISCGHGGHVEGDCAGELRAAAARLG